MLRVLLPLLLLVGCPTPQDDDIEGNSPEDCQDLSDNDGDFDIDCRDEDCAIYDFCNEGDDDDSAGDDDDSAAPEPTPSPTPVPTPTPTPAPADDDDSAD